MTNMPKQAQNDPRGGWSSASNAEADALCAGRMIAQRGLPEHQSDDADFGTQIHAALAANDPKGLSLEQVDIYDSCQKIAGKLVADCFGEENGPKVIPYKHRRFWLTLKGPQTFKHSGEADAVYHLDNRLLILDFKCLPGQKTESSRNGQLRDLAVLACGEIPGVNEVVVAIVQPLVTHTPEPCIYGADDLKQAALELYARIVKSNDPNSPRVAGEKQCGFCLAKPHCAEYQKFAGAMLPAMLSILDVPAANWTPEQCAVFCERRPVAQKWLDEVESAMKARLAADPAGIPGFGLKPGAIKETIKDPQACFERFAALGGTVPQFMQVVSVGKKKLAEAVHEVTAAKGKNLDKAVAALCAGITESKQNAPSLARVKE